MQLRYAVSHVPRKEPNTADILQQAPLQTFTQEDGQLQQHVNIYIDMALRNLSATGRQIQEIQKQLEEDKVSRHIVGYCREGWPDKSALKRAFKNFATVTHKIMITDDTQRCSER